ncbi:MAG: hypothetical protein IIA59_08805 [Candidatus Marinimicrobia bacterium]|nr:hypothetical protein [Candidatus Neomarinimicrobiota bacterium]
MDSINIAEGLTLKDLVLETGAPPHVIRYLHGLGRLPILRESPGAGYPIIFSSAAISIIRTHLTKSGKSRN